MSQTITILKNGPIKVAVDALELKDASGAPIDTGGKKEIYLCRCGASSKKPFCDGSHNRIGFQHG